MTTTLAEPTACTARIHGTASAARRSGCTHPEAVTAWKAQRSREGAINRQRKRQKSWPAQAVVEPLRLIPPKVTIAAPDVFDWRDQAACRENSEPFDRYVDKSSVTHAKAARRVCGVCPVRGECLNDAVTSGDQHGIRAGMTPDQRQTHRAALDRVEWPTVKEIQNV